MTSLVAEEGTAGTAGHGTEETAILLGHRRGVGVVVGGVGIGGLAGCLGIRLLALALRLAVQCALVRVHPLLILSEGVVGAALRVGALRIATVVGTVVVSLLTVLEAAVLRGSKAVLTTGRAKILVLIILLAVTLLRRIALLLAVALLSIALLRWVAATLVVAAVAAAVIVVRTRHVDGCWGTRMWWDVRRTQVMKM